MNFIYFLGRFHVLVLHLPIALVLTVVVLESLSERDRYRHLENAVPLLWAATALTSVVTVVLGYMHFAEGVFTGTSASAHRLLGTSIAVVSTAAWLTRTLRASTFRKVRPVVSILLVALVVLTGHYGGNLTHGDTFLVEYAPEPLRRLAGLEASRPPVTDLAMADPYLDIVKPIFSQRCLSCHNDEKQRGGLSLARYDAVMKGGKDGPVVARGAPEKSDLYRRISLPQNHKDFMPAEGKTPLSQQQQSVIRWWIESGAGSGTPLGTKISAQARPLLEASLGLGVNSPEPGLIQEDPARRADMALVAALNGAGFIARQLSLADPRLIVSAAAPGGRYDAQQLAVLEKAKAEIVELEMERSNLGDEALGAIARLEQLSKLRLDNNHLTDAGLPALLGLKHLQHLNLHANPRITDASIDVFSKLTELRTLYVWGTGISPRGTARLLRERPELLVNVGSDPGAPQRVKSR